ncbi:hypothetical protein [Vibrio hyugaensis]|nr:hypothetical protein [Vibrio hyugaensis]
MQMKHKTKQGIEEFDPSDINPNAYLFGMVTVVIVFIFCLLVMLCSD